MLLHNDEDDEDEDDKMRIQQTNNTSYKFKNDSSEIFIN